MFKIIGIIVLGVIIGYLFRSKIKPNVVSKVMTVVIYLLLLILGIAVGANKEIMSNLATLGLNALIITMASILGSCIFAYFIYTKLFKNKQK